MTTKQQIINRAQAAGSGAKTFRGALKALRAGVRDVRKSLVYSPRGRYAAGRDARAAR